MAIWHIRPLVELIAKLLDGQEGQDVDKEHVAWALQFMVQTSMRKMRGDSKIIILAASLGMFPKDYKRWIGLVKRTRGAFAAIAGNGDLELMHRVFCHVPPDERKLEVSKGLVLAARHGAAIVVPELLKLVLEIDKSDFWEAAQAAMRSQHPETLRELLPSVAQSSLSSLLITCMQTGSVEMFEILVKTRLDVRELMTARNVERATLHGHSELVIHMLSNYDLPIPWDHACATGNVKLIKFFRGLVADPPPLHVLHTACRYCSLETVRALTASYSSHLFPSYFDPMVAWAAEKGRLEILEYLVHQLGLDPSNTNNLAIRWAAANGHASTVRFLLTFPTVDPSTCAQSALKCAAHKGHEETVRVLLAHPAVYAPSSLLRETRDRPNMLKLLLNL